MDTSPGIKIPIEQLAPETLHNVIEEFVTRDGTDLVDADEKVDQVMRLLRRGQLELWFDTATATCNILERERPQGR
ncbi:MAG: YheU family protein [Planctomycetota bacterium]